MSKPVLTYDNGKVLGIYGSQDGDVLTWVAANSGWSAVQPTGGGGGTSNPTVSFNSRAFVVGDSAESGKVSISGTAPYSTGSGTYTFNLTDKDGVSVTSWFNALATSVALANTNTYASINNIGTPTSTATARVSAVTVNASTAVVTFDSPLFASGTLSASSVIVFSWTFATSIPYDLAGRVIGNPQSSDILFDMVAERKLTVTPNIEKHSFYVKTLGTNSVILYVKRYSSNTSSTILTVTYPTASTGTIEANGYYKASTIVLTEGETGVVNRGDRVTVEIATTDPLFNTPLFTVNASI